MVNWMYLTKNSRICSDLEKRIGILEGSVSIEFTGGTYLQVADGVLPSKDGKTYTQIQPDRGEIGEINVFDELQKKSRFEGARINKSGKDFVILSVGKNTYHLIREPIKSP